MSDSELDRRKFLRRSAVLGATAVGYDLLVTPAGAWAQTAPGPHAHELLVAASNATSRVKASAAYVCDGTDDQAEIIAAANEAVSTGGCLVLSEGTFNIDSPVLKAGGANQRFWTNLTIRGQGRSTRLHNRQDGGGVNDKYVFYVWGADAQNPVRGARLEDFAIYGDEYTANTKGQHGISVHFAEDFSFDNLYFENLSEEGLVLDSGTRHVQGGRLHGKNLGSAVIDLAGCEHITIDQIFSTDVCQVEDSASVQIFDGSTVGRIPKHISIGKIHALRPGHAGLRIISSEDVNIGQVVVEGATTGSRRSANAVISYKSPENPIPRNINIGQVIARNCGAKTNEPSLRALNTANLNVQQLITEGGYGAGIHLNTVSQSHFGQVTVYNPSDIGQAPAPNAIELAGSGCVDNTFDQMVVRGWLWGAGNGAALSCGGLRNIFSMLQVSGDASVTGADWWDVNFASGSKDNILLSAILSGHGRGGINDAGTGNQVDRVVKGINGVSYKPYQNSGTATVPNGTTSVDVTHGLAFTPTARNVELVPTNNLGVAAKWWVSHLGATTFRINTDVDPGASTATFAWRAGPS